MRFSISMFILLVVSLTAAAAFAEKSCLVVEPGKAIGPVKVGMTRADLEAAGLTVEKGPMDSMLKVDSQIAYLDDSGTVRAVGADSGTIDCLRIAGVDVTIRGASLESLATASRATCGPMQFNTGATVIDCAEGVTISGHMGGVEVRVSAPAKAPEQVCHTWVQPGTLNDKVLVEGEVADKTNVCVQHMVLTSDLVPKDIIELSGKMHISTCERQDNRGATVLDCHYSGLRLVFAGPELRLHRVESIALRK